MGDTRRRVPLWPAVICALVLAAGGFWLGRSDMGSAQRSRVVSGTVSAVGQPANEFAVTLDGTTTTAGFPLGPVPWIDGTNGGAINLGSTAPCISVGRHVIFGVVAVTFAGTTSDQVEWVECA